MEVKPLGRTAELRMLVVGIQNPGGITRKKNFSSYESESAQVHESVYSSWSETQILLWKYQKILIENRNLLVINIFNFSLCTWKKAKMLF